MLRGWRNEEFIGNFCWSLAESIDYIRGRRRGGEEMFEVVSWAGMFSSSSGGSFAFLLLVKKASPPLLFQLQT